MEESIDLLEEVNNISKIHSLSRSDIDNLMIEIARRVLKTLRLERMSVWIFDKHKTELVSIGEYHLPTEQFSKDNHLKKDNYPTYFNAIVENEIVLVENVHTNPLTMELDEDYSMPNNVISLMDIPLRMEGELIGVMCFEKTGDKERMFSRKEQVFALSIAIIFASNMEARYRRALQKKLDEELKEKTILLKEVHHRVKNNLSVVSSLINLQASKAMDSFHRTLFKECKTKINSIANIHEFIYKSKSLSKIDLKLYFGRLINELEEFYSSEGGKVKIEKEITEGYLELEQAIPLALIINEVITNAFKHAFVNENEGKIKVVLSVDEKEAVLRIRDNGIGIQTDLNEQKSLGIEIIESLTKQLEGRQEYVVDDGTAFSLRFPVVMKHEEVIESE
ncbi:histidine kinase dimerization/phosphoacceptor domain -containing protein [Parvicella tangerina]|uniref:histidine kinase n=1 Tax=Parvicella tangerina TaxID=2829795 RepID=A0A916NRK4_9FLAO|nr:histidine kinase dimerization/phosphoacceptor domain -containing protein [Parvicella tangerina]CAG5081414.1 hypothetical protein CRYO30217_01626 [Parvicella tangerina]